MSHLLGNPSADLQGSPRSQVRLCMSWQTLSSVQHRNIAHLYVLPGQVARHYCLSVHTILQEIARHVQYWRQQPEARDVNWLKRAKMLCSAVHMGILIMMLCGDFLAPGSSVRCFCLLLFLHCSTEAGGHLFVYRIIYTAITRGLGVIIQYSVLKP